MNSNLLREPNRTKNVELEEIRRLINLLSWSRFEAACYLSGKALLDFEEFQSTPTGYQEKLDELLKNSSTDPCLLQEFQKYKTKYPDIEEMYNALEQLPKPRTGTVQTDKYDMIASADPMVWIKLAMENNLFVAPGINEAWIIFQYRAKKRYLPPKKDCKKSKRSQIKKINFEEKESTNSRPLHEPADIDNIQELGRNIFRKNLDWSKQTIAKELCKIYQRANLYNQFSIVKWLSWASIARREKGCHKNLPNEP